jgi:tetratricopeptide (TPR) repeat protein
MLWRSKKWMVVSGLLVVGTVGCGVGAERNAIRKTAGSGRAALVAKHAASAIAQLDAACREATCGCATTGGRALLDSDLGTEALALLEAAPKLCGQPPAGMRAEALARSGDSAGPAAAKAVVAADSQDAFAHQALALIAYREGRLPDAMQEVGLARTAGRGGTALLLQGLVWFAQGDLGAAERAFSEIVRLSPADLVARYNLALVAQKLGRFHDAREGYLSVLADDPKNLDARFNLGVLTWQAGAMDEARHHLDKLREVAPKGSDLVPRLQAMLERPPAPAAQIDPGRQSPRSAAGPIVVTNSMGTPPPRGPSFRGPGAAPSGSSSAR